MNFFYEAMQKETGVATASCAEETPVPVAEQTAASTERPPAQVGDPGTGLDDVFAVVSSVVSPSASGACPEQSRRAPSAVKRTDAFEFVPPFVSPSASAPKGVGAFEAVPQFESPSASFASSEVNGVGPNFFTIPPSAERMFAVPTADMTKDRAQALEQCRAMRSRVLEIVRTSEKRTLMVTSAVAGEGKTVTSFNLALAASRVEAMRVLLVDADLRKPGIAALLGIPATRGLLDCLQKAEGIAGLTWQVSPSLDIVPSVGSIENSAELLHSSNMQQFVEEVKGAYDLVIFDSPPMHPIADAQVLSAYLDGVIFCIRAGRTPADLVSDSVSLIQSKVIGVVLVGSDDSGAHDYPYRYYRGYRKKK